MASTATGHRTYEIYQRERVGQSTALIKPRQLMSAEYRRDPYPLVAILRENYPCYRDWVQNCFWITRYDDVTSVFVDDPNYETRPKRWFYGLSDLGRDLRGEVPVLAAQAGRVDAAAAPIAERVVASFAGRGTAELATEFAARYPLELLGAVLDLPSGDLGGFSERYWRMQRGVHADPRLALAGRAAIDELVEYFRPLVEKRRADPGDDMISALALLEVEGGPVTAEDVVVTLLESDHETLHGGLANLWFLLLTHPDQIARVRTDRLMMKFAYLEMLRHSTPVITAKRFARHEVERFGRLLPEGALLMCSAAAANRDPRAFRDPDAFIVGRKDLCQREPRGQFRADGLPAGIAFGMGHPSRHPAEPEDRPRSLYALTRDTAVAASNVLLDALGDIRLTPGAAPHLVSLQLGEMHTCWNLPVEFTAA